MHLSTSTAKSLLGFHQKIAAHLLEIHQFEYYLGLWKDYYSASPPFPSRQKIWEYFLEGLLSAEEREQTQWPFFLARERIVSVFANSSLYADSQSMRNRLHRTPLRNFSEERKQELVNRLLLYQNFSVRWQKGDFISELLNRPGEMVLEISRETKNDAWFIAKIVQQQGYQSFHSQRTARAFGIFTREGQNTRQFSYADWIDALQDISPEQASQLNLWGEWIFGSIGRKKSQHFDVFSPLFESSEEEKTSNALLSGHVNAVSDQALFTFLFAGRHPIIDVPFEQFEGHYAAYQKNYNTFANNGEHDDWVAFWKGVQEFQKRSRSQKKNLLHKKIQSAEAVYEALKHRFDNEQQEAFYTVILDNRNCVIDIREITKGILNQALVHPREVFAPAIQLRAAGIILIHNHPAGKSTPSTADFHVTKKLCSSGAVLSLPVIDHIIFGKDEYYSFVDNNRLPPSSEQA